MKRLLIFCILFLLHTKPSLASGLELTRIGQMDTTGGFYREWWYTGSNPNLQGLSQPNSAITISVDSVSNTITSDGSGYWIYSKGGLESGDHDVQITDGSDTLSFTLHSGQAMDGTANSTITNNSESNGAAEDSDVEMPVSGSLEYTLVTLAGGFFLLYLGFKSRKALLYQKV